MEWTNEKALEFLELYKGEPSLWNSRSKHYKSRGAHQHAWQRIMKNLSFRCTIDDLKKKKESLMNYYRTHLHRYKQSSESGVESELYCTTWYAFELMDSFLRPVYEPKSEFNSEDPLIDGKEDSEAEEETNQDIDSPTQSPTYFEQNSFVIEGVNSLRSPEHSTSKRRRFAKRRAPTPEINPNKHMADFDPISANKSQKPNVDEYDLFGSLIAAKIRKMNDDFDKETLMNDIQNLIFQTIMRNRTSCGSTN